MHCSLRLSGPPMDWPRSPATTIDVAATKIAIRAWGGPTVVILRLLKSHRLSNELPTSERMT